MAQPRPCDPRHFRALRSLLEEMGATDIRFDDGGRHGRVCYTDPAGVPRFEVIAHGFDDGRKWRGHVRARLRRTWTLTKAHQYA